MTLGLVLIIIIINSSMAITMRTNQPLPPVVKEAEALALAWTQYSNVSFGVFVLLRPFCSNSEHRNAGR